MTNEELIEQTARVIYEADDPWHKAWPWPDLQEQKASVEQYRHIARAALRVIAPAVLERAAEAVTCGGVGVRDFEQVIAEDIRNLAKEYSDDQ